MSNAEDAATAGRIIKLKCSNGFCFEVNEAIAKEFSACKKWSKKVLDDVLTLKSVSQQHLATIIAFCAKQVEFRERAADESEMNGFLEEYKKGLNTDELWGLTKAVHSLGIPFLFNMLKSLIVDRLRGKSAEFIITFLGIGRKVNLDTGVRREILLWMPGTQLVGLSRVSESVRSLIAMPDFVEAHLKCMKQQLSAQKPSHAERVFGRIKNSLTSRFNGEGRSCSLYSIFEDTEVELDEIPECFVESRIVGSVNGLLCSVGMYTVHIRSPNSGHVFSFRHWDMEFEAKSGEDIPFGFGYDGQRDVYKVLQLCPQASKVIARVFDLKTCTWRVIDGFDYGIKVSNEVGTFVDGCLFFRMDSEKIIVSFNLSTEKFNITHLPNRFNENMEYWTLRPVGESVGLFCYGDGFCVGWLMKPSSAEWVKTFTVKTDVLNCKSTRAVYISDTNRILLHTDHNLVICDTKENRFRCPAPDAPAYDFAVIYLDTLVVLPHTAKIAMKKKRDSKARHESRMNKMLENLGIDRSLSSYDALAELCLMKGLPAPCYLAELQPCGGYTAAVSLKGYRTQESEESLRKKKTAGLSKALDLVAEAMLEYIAWAGI